MRQEEAFVAQAADAGKPNCVQTAVAGRVGRRALRPPYDLVLGGGMGRIGYKVKMGGAIADSAAPKCGAADNQADR